MGKLAFVFSGQGAQYSGMGYSFYQNSKAASQIFQKASAIRPGTRTQCFSSEDEKLRETRITQPCLYTVEMAIAAALTENGIYADMTAGFSLGELSALTYSEAISFEEGLRLVMLRGELMQEAAEETPTAMYAVLKLTDAEVECICRSFSHVFPVNYNCPGQISVSGAIDEMQSFCQTVGEAGGKAVPLKVNGAFHSCYMSKAAESFAHVLEKTAFRQPQIPLFSNYTGQQYAENILDSLIPQMDHPVRWEKTIRNMIAAGVDTFLEVGPGKTLSGLIRRISREVRVFSISEYEDLSAFSRR